jgi:hypothetical protein
MSLFSFLYNNKINIFYLINYLFFLGFLNIIFFNEEFIICISLLIYFLALFLVLRKITLNFFFSEIEYIYLLFYLIIGLNILFINSTVAYLNLLSDYSYFLKNDKLYFLFSFFINKFLNILFYFKKRCKEISTLFNYVTNFNYSNFLDIYFAINNQFFNKIMVKNIDYLIVKILCFFNSLYFTFLFNITFSYVS